MRFHNYDPVTVSKRFHKLAAEVTPYKAKDGFVSTEQKIFITQDEIDSFMIKSVMVVAIVSKETLARTSLWNIVREMLSCLFCM